MGFSPGIDTKIILLAAGLIFLLALVLGVWKYRQIMAADRTLGSDRGHCCSGS